jgi:hypothetical protein
MLVLVVLCALSSCARGDVERKDEKRAGISPTESVAPLPMGGGPSAPVVRNVVPILAVPEAEVGAYVGAWADLHDVAVRGLASDRAFWIGEAPNELVLVVLDPQASIGTDRAGHVALPRGQIVTVHGTIRAVPTDEGARRAFHLDAAQAKQLERTRLYVDARRVDVVE